MPPNSLVGLPLHNVARRFAKIAFDVFVVIDIAEEADALAILAARVDEMFAFGHFAHFVFHEMPDGKDGFLQLPTINLREKIGLIFHWVGTCREPFAAVDPLGLRIMSRGDEGIIVTHFLVESAKFDEPIAHHVGVGCVAGAHLFHGVARHLVPIFAVAIHNFELAAIALGHGCRHLHILFAVAIPFALASHHGSPTRGAPHCCRHRPRGAVQRAALRVRYNRFSMYASLFPACLLMRFRPTFMRSKPKP